jgi:hypothetical protein
MPVREIGEEAFSPRMRGSNITSVVIFLDTKGKFKYFDIEIIKQ